jgi:glycine C-acetyltransferase
MFDKMKEKLTKELADIRQAGLYKEERIILTDQKPDIRVSFPAAAEPKQVLNFCANNYLGLANHPKIIAAAKQALDTHGFGMSSVRFICGTQDIHKQLEATIAKFYETEDTILYSSCYDANGGLFECLLGADDAVITDALNHASIIDGIRLCKAKRYIYKHGDMIDLEDKIKEAAASSKQIMVATDSVFSMDGDVAKLDKICALAEKYQVMVMADESHATGFFGRHGRGAIEHCQVLGKVDVITSTLGKAMGGASGGFTTGKKEIIELLRQRSRPYLFSNSLAPAITAAAITAFELLSDSDELRKVLAENTLYFRKSLTQLGFETIAGIHPIVPIMFGKFDNDAQLAQNISKDLYQEGIYVVGFFFPVVPKGAARIRVQLSAAHTRKQIDHFLNCLKKIGKKHQII